MSTEESSTTTFEPFSAQTQQAIADRANQRKVREVYVPPGGLPKVTNPGAGYNPSQRHVTAMDAPVSPVAETPQQAHQRVLAETYAPSSSITSTPSTPTRAVADAVALDLPTRFSYYDFKDIYVTPFKGMHLAKLSRGNEEESLLHVVEAVSSVLSTSSGQPNLAPLLSINDFYFILYWLRTNSFTKSQYIHKSYCVNEAHHLKVQAGELDSKTLFTSTTITKSSLKTNYLDDLPSEESFALEYPGAYLRPTTMQDTLDVLDSPQFEDEEFQYLAQLAAFVRLESDPSLGVVDRVAIVADMSPDDVATIRKYEKLMSQIGVVETVNVKCLGCGASSVSKLTLDARNFLPTSEDE